MPPQEKQLEGMVTTETAVMMQEIPASDRKGLSPTKRSRRKTAAPETEAPKAGETKPALEVKESVAKLRKRAKSAVANDGEAEQEPGIASPVVITEDIPAAKPAESPMGTRSALLQVLEGTLKKKERNETHEQYRVYIRKDLKKRLDALAEHQNKGFKTLLLNYGLEKTLDELELALKNDEE
ncbi:hypothetical protein [Paenibacillus naphthalenovorans]|uniref:Uncharacterized protein n=1 Tax=Paenibacillus naphthalenovorans TaxID=162209 RepID=A0A0U2N0C3_9BACL|nr:hypothetical protein [Paenibacillus naphthalenovorans]ALS24271.1 hypothetical protein IJ22_39590 [Paenibacillus naphthalenovorans]SDI51897.1 hypothetical protein SAMN05421868_107119 [Paenibacillus naphthalenovorans]